MESGKPIDLELSLLPTAAHNSVPMARGESPEQQQQLLTIFYDGRICVSDATELRAKAIILVASREMEGRKRSPSESNQLSPSLKSQLCSPPGASMKRSLHRFLQKRRNRIEALSPYNRQ